MKRASTVAWRGISPIDGAPIMLVISIGSANPKTGDMAQSWILRTDVAPHVATRTGEDRSVCGGCPFRPFFRKRAVLRGQQGRGCYVKTFQAPRSTWAKNRDCSADLAGARALIGQRMLRIGSYGDPGMVPDWVWFELMGQDHAKPRTGYNHQWRWRTGHIPDWTMASCENADDKAKAGRLGYATFRVMRPGDAPQADETLCPASKEAGADVTCHNCGRCDGQSGNIAIYQH